MEPRRPIAQCLRCKALVYSADDHLAVLSPGAKPSDDYERFQVLCEKCFCAMGPSGGRAWWERAHRPDHGWVCTCTWKHTFAELTRTSEACPACVDSEPFVTNFKAVLRSIRIAKPWLPALDVRCYNKLGRMVPLIGTEAVAKEMSAAQDRAIAAGRIKRTLS